MSMNITVRLRDGQAEVSASGQIEDGEVTVHSSVDASYRLITVTQRDAEGRYVAGANHSHPIGE